MERSVAEKIRFWSIPVGIVVIAGLLITIIVLQVRSSDEASRGNSAAEAGDVEQQDLSFLETRSINDVQSAGDLDAPVGLIVFSDYQCAYCARWNEEVLPELMDQVEDGALRIEWRDVNTYGEISERAARAAHAAGIQGQYWEYHSELFPDGDTRSMEGLSEESLVTIAEDLGLDPVQFREDLNSEQTHAQIQNYASIGRDLGVNATPTFILGGEPLVGAQPYDVFMDTLDRAHDNAE